GRDGRASRGGIPLVRTLLASTDSLLREDLATRLAATHQVVPCGDGRKVVDLLRSEAFELLLVDVELGGISAFEVCHFVRRRPSFQGLRVVLLVRGGADEAVRGHEAGADAYLTLPLQSGRLNDGITRSAGPRPTTGEMAIARTLWHLQHALEDFADAAL